jgi:acetyl-CoA carboxylase carboxyltransferase component
VPRELWKCSKEERLVRSLDETERSKYIQEKESEYEARFANPYQAAKYGFIDDIIEPRNSRFRVIRALQALSTKKDYNPPKKHSNIPL